MIRPEPSADPEADRYFLPKDEEMKPLLAITMGDATGSGPEIIVKSSQEKGLYELARLIVIGDLKIIKRAAGIVKSTKIVREIQSPAEAGCRSHSTAENSVPATAAAIAAAAVPPLP